MSKWESEAQKVLTAWNMFRMKLQANNSTVGTGLFFVHMIAELVLEAACCTLAQ